MELEPCLLMKFRFQVLQAAENLKNVFCRTLYNIWSWLDNTYLKLYLDIIKVHDDVIDHSEYRRGKQSINNR